VQVNFLYLYHLTNDRQLVYFGMIRITNVVHDSYHNG